MTKITFQKRQKEMKRLEKAKVKAEKRAERKLNKGTETEEPLQVMTHPPRLDPEILLDLEKEY
jgi:hypothetical protein